MNILHITNLSNNLSSGLTYAVNGLFENQKAVLRTVDLLNLNKNSDYNHKHLNIKDFNLISLINLLKKYDVIVFHSNYIIGNMLISLVLRVYKIPYIIVPHGGFTKTALEIKATKKKIANLLFFKSYFNSAIAFHFLTENEKEISIYKTKNDFVIPNGIFPTDFTVKRQNIYKKKQHCFYR